MFAVLVGLALSALGRPSGEDSALYSNGKCYSYVQTGNVHWGIAPPACRDMAALDRRLNMAYRKRLASLNTLAAKADLRSSQRDWIGSRNATCHLSEPIDIADEPTSDCFIAETKKRIEFFERSASPIIVQQERWIAISTTAISITGDILLSPTRLQMVGQALPLRVAADLPDFDGDAGRVAARVLAVKRPSELRLLNGNRFGCGRPIRWIVVWQQDAGEILTMDTFMGQKMPTSVRSGDFCASYSYSRG